MSASSVEAQALAMVKARIRSACLACGRAPDSVRLLAVAKQQSVEKIRAAHAAGQRAFGENYVQEWLDKAKALRDLVDIEWHLIGPLQSNKTRVVAEHAHWVHSIDRLKIAERLSQQRPDHLPPLAVLVQVNISGEASKSGVPPHEAQALIDAVARLPRLALRGVMGMPEPDLDEAATRSQFEGLARIFHEAQERHPQIDTLSMGMSADLELAIACGSTLVRVGTAVFGPRP